MAARAQQDAFMEDSEDTCPLCVEELDLSDKNFRPCPCGYQICQFCYNNIKNNMNGLCPACRRPYDDKTIEWKIISAEEFKADIANSARRKAAARQKEAERKQVETLNRKHLQGLRVVQRNLVYITGMSSEGVPDDQLEDQLRGGAVFGQYGRIIKLSANKLKDTGGGNSALAIFITFADEESASRCIAALDGRVHQSRILKAQHGTTKYCSAFLRNEICNNRNCTFLHEAGEDRDSFSRQELSSLNAASSQARPQQGSSVTARPQPPQHSNSHAANSASASAGTVHRSETMSRSDSGDGPALPSTANWAKNPQLHQSRRSSQAASRATPSPQVANARITSHTRPDSRVSTKMGTSSAMTKEPEREPEGGLSEEERAVHPTDQSQANRHVEAESFQKLRSACIRAFSQPMTWTLDRTVLDEEALRVIDTFAPLIEVNGGVARRELRERMARRRRRQEDIRNQVTTNATLEDEDNRISGSLQLGGEPDVGEDAMESVRSRSNAGGIFSHQAFDSNPATSPFVQSSLMNEFSSLDNVNGGVSSQQRGGVSSSKSVQENDPLLQHFQRAPTTSQHHSTLSNPFQGQNPILSGHSRHGRTSSRYTFANDSNSATATVKPTANTQLLAQQSAMMPSQNKPFSAQPNLQTGFYSGVQGPPPGLKSSGTPPISGGGMFGQGHGFANAMGGSLNFGSQLPAKASNDNDAMLLRARTGTSGGPGPDTGKRSTEQRARSTIAIGLSVATLARDSQRQGVLAETHSRTSVAEDFPPLVTQKQASFTTSDSRVGQNVSQIHDAVTAPASSTQERSSLIDVAGAQQDEHLRTVLATTVSTGPDSNESKHRQALDAGEKPTGNKSPVRQDKQPVGSQERYSKLQFGANQNARAGESLEDLSSDRGLNNDEKQEAVQSYSNRLVNPSVVSTANTVATIQAASIVKGPRTLRVIETPKPETHNKNISKMTFQSSEVAWAGPTSGGKDISRRTSLASITIPSTPSNEPQSETASYTESHPDSPAGGKSSGGSLRVKTKSQAKKERRARRAEESKLSDTLAVDSPELEVVQEAIVGRKKKNRKEKAPPNRSQRTVSRTSKKARVEEDEDEEEEEDEEEGRAEGKEGKGGEGAGVENGEDDANVGIHKDHCKPSIMGDKSAATTAAPDTTPVRPPTTREQIEAISIGELLQDLLKSGELDQETVDLVMNPSSRKILSAGPTAQTMVGNLSAEERSRLEYGTPVAVLSKMFQEHNSLDIASHPYPYSIVLPNPERTIIPMATKLEADLSVKLYANVFKDPSARPRSSLADSVYNALKSGSIPADDLSPLEMALSYFSSFQEIQSDDGEDAQQFAVRYHISRSGSRGDLDAEDELIRLNPAVHRWMEDSTREIQAFDAAMGGNHFERARAATLGHGPIRLDPASGPGLVGAVPPPPPPPMSTHPILGARGHDSANSRRGEGLDPIHTGDGSFDMFRQHLELISEPLRYQNLAEEVQELSLVESEQRLREAEEYVARLKSEAENAERKLAGLVKKNNKLFRLQSKQTVG